MMTDNLNYDSTLAELEHALAHANQQEIRLQASLDEKQAELNTLLKGSPTIIMSLDQAGRILHINHLTTDFEIYDVEGGDACTEIFVDCDDAVLVALRAAFDDFEVTQLETTTIIGECLTRFTPVVHKGVVQKVMAISLDISPLKQKEREVQLILKHSPTIITTIDLDARILEFNHLTPSFELYDMVGSDVCESLFCGDVASIRETIQQVIEQKKLIQVETDTIVGDCLSRFTPMIVNGMIQKIMIISMDITYVKKAEADLRFLNAQLTDAKNDLQVLNEQLEEKVLQRTMELEQLSQKMLTSNITINRKNLIINSLFETCTRIHHSGDLDIILNFSLKQLKALFCEWEFAIFITGGRGDVIESIAFSDVADSIRVFIINNHMALLDPLKARNNFDGFSRASGTPEAPFVWDVLVLSGRDEKEMGKLVIMGGKPDIATKKILSVFLEQISAAGENILLSKKLTQMAYVDGLTGVYNRAYFDTQLDRMQNQFIDAKIRFSVLAIDINGLKRINDQYGHFYGDQLICEAAKVLKKCCRGSDIIARIGGDEFAVLCASIDLVQIATIITRIREIDASIECANDEQSETVPVRMSLGSACAGADDVSQIMDIADGRMYEDKKAFYEKQARYR